MGRYAHRFCRLLDWSEAHRTETKITSLPPKSSAITCQLGFFVCDLAADVWDALTGQSLLGQPPR
eukprot:15453653-Alexandrium_andersonii.AAC.1